jgi:hypothetical protein
MQIVCGRTGLPGRCAHFLYLLTAQHAQVANACKYDDDCLVYDIRRRASALVRLGSVPGITAAALAAGFPSRTAFLDTAERHMETLYLVSTFCLIPPGDTATRKALFDAILFGCVPVLFYPESAAFPWHLPVDAAEFAVMLHPQAALEDPLGVMRALRAERNEALRRKQKVMVRLAHRLQYGVAEEGVQHVPDAFDVLIAGVWLASGTTGH